MVPNSLQFDALWRMHPATFHEVKILGRLIKTPRWQQAYGVNYSYTGSVNNALQVPTTLMHYLNWARENVHGDLNGLLLNWYDGKLGHYIGRHRDSVKQMHPGAPIVTMSFGEERVFRVRRWRAKVCDDQPTDFVAKDGTVFIMSWEANRSFTHEIVRSKRQTGRRISVTLRALENPSVDD
jgi:alkylated DNA repair dioxygenase AlkB